MTPSTSTWKTNLNGSWRGIPSVLSQHWRHLLVRWYMSPPSPVTTWMRFTLRRSCFLPLLMVKLSRRWCWSIFLRYLIQRLLSKSSGFDLCTSHKIILLMPPFSTGNTILLQDPNGKEERRGCLSTGSWTEGEVCQIEWRRLQSRVLWFLHKFTRNVIW